MSTRKKVVRNSTTKKRKTFIYSHDKSIADKQFVQLFLPVLQKSSKWNFQEFNKNKMYDLVNSKHNSVFSNNSYINNYVGGAVCSLTDKYKFHQCLNHLDFVPETQLIYNNIDDIVLGDGVYLLKADRLEYAKGITIVSKKEDINVKEGDKYVLQKKITNLKLIDGKRFDIRQYVIIVYDHDVIQFYLFDRFYLRKSSLHYDAASLDKAANAVNFDSKRTFSFPAKGDLYEQIMKESTEKLKIALRCMTMKNSNNIKGFHILGIDWLMDANDSLWFIEVNHRPTLVHADIITLSKLLVKTVIHRVVEPLLACRAVRSKKLILL